MASLKEIIKNHWYYIASSITWVVIWKEGRSWHGDAFSPKSGDFDNGFVFDDNDLAKMKQISECDHNAICINGIWGSREFIRLKILRYYSTGSNQLNGDFLQRLVKREHTMTRQECEQQILGKLREIASIAKEYNPDTNYLGLQFRLDDNWANLNNSYFDNQSHDANKPINFCVFNFLDKDKKEDTQ